MSMTPSSPMSPLCSTAHSPIMGVLGALILAVVLAGCSSESKLANHQAHADRFFAEEKYEESVIEYSNVLRIDGENKHAIRQLGLAYHILGDLRRAYPFLRKTADLNPGDTEIRLKLGALYLAGRAHDKAREEAVAILKGSSTNLPAMLLLIDTSVSTNELEEATLFLAAIADELGDDALYRVAQGNLYARTQDIEAAYQAYLSAIEADPGSVAARLSVANLLRARGDVEQAADNYRIAADFAPAHSTARIRWADFELGRGNPSLARKILQPALEDAPNSATALFGLARIAFAEREFDECISILDRIIDKRGDGDPMLLLLKADVKMAKGENDEAIALYDTLIDGNPQSPLLRHRVALARLRKNDIRKAILHLEKALETAPQYAEAVLLLADLRLRTGNARAAIDPLETLLRERPHLPQAYALLGTAYRIQKQLDKSLKAYGMALALTPDDARIHYMLGLTFRAQEKADAARKAFSNALDLKPDFVSPLAQLTAMDAAAGSTNAAIARIEQQIELLPDHVPLKYLLGTTLLRFGEAERAEKAFLEVIENEPRILGAYRALGKIYVSEGREEEATTKIQAALAVRPNDTASLMMMAALHQRKNDVAAATGLYEQILERHPNFVGAVNNLACLYADDPDKLDQAYELASNARNLSPKNPYLGDTFGWVLYRRGEYLWALNTLMESADALPGQAEVLYHLGMAHCAVGDEAAAIEALTIALAEDATFTGSEEAARLLSVLRIEPDSTMDDDVTKRLETAVELDPGNAAAMYRLAVIHARADRPERAKTLLEKALAAKPLFVPAIVSLAELHVEHFADPEKAMELAGKANQCSPDDPGIVAAVAWISYRAGNHKWALSLLQKCAEKLPDNQQVHYRLGLTHYMLGDVTRALLSVEKSLSCGQDFDDADEARRFMSLVKLSLSPASRGAVPAEVSVALKDDPSYIPALMVVAAVHRGNGAMEEATHIYAKIVEENPEFAPAVAKLAEVYADSKEMNEQAFTLAKKARSAMPDDPEVARTLGRLCMEREDYEYALLLLSESVAKLPEDAEAHYYLGMCQHSLGKKDEATQFLGRALDLDPDSAYATNAKQLLSEL